MFARGCLLLALCLACGVGLPQMACEPTPSKEKSPEPTVPDASAPKEPDGPLKFTALTFNAGTTPGLAHDKGEDTKEGDGYTSAHAKIADESYENSLAWNPAERALVQWLAKKKPDVAAFQELYYDKWCEDIKVDPALDFVCKGYTAQRPLQIQRLLGPDYSIACAQGQDDNCVGVHKRFGVIVGCQVGKVCVGMLEGSGPPNKCSRGARVGQVDVKLVDGRMLRVVVVHGTSGIKDKDMDCRKEQFRQIFEDKGDGEAAASGPVNLILGDINTDPFLRAKGDPSAAYWNQFVGEGKAFHYISSHTDDGPRTYGGLFRIDHIVSDKLQGGPCEVAGVTEGHPPVLDAIYWDHKPVLCELRWPK